MGRPISQPPRLPAGRRDASRHGRAHGRVDGLHLGGADPGHERSWASPAASARAWRSCGRSTSRPTSSSSTSRRWASRSRRPRSSSASSRASGPPASRRSSSTTTSSTSTRWPIGSWSSTAAASPASSRPRATRSRSSWASCARSPRPAPSRRPSATACRRRCHRRGRRAAVSAVPRTQASRRNGVGTAPRTVGVADRHHHRVPPALDRVRRPGAEDVPRHADLPVVRPDDAVLRDHRDVAHDGDRRRRHRPLVPLDDVARHGRLRRAVAGHRQRRSWASSARSASASCAGSSTGSSSPSSASRRWS